MSAIANWIRSFWNRHGTKVLSVCTFTAGAYQAAMVAGIFETTNTERRVCAYLVIGLATWTFARSVGSPPKNPEP